MSEGRITRDDLNPNVLESLRGPQGEPGQQGAPGIPGEQGLPGNDAEVTSENIERALGFVPTELQIATESTLGGIKPDGETITVDPETGIATAVGGGSGISEIPLATADTVGGIKIRGESAFSVSTNGTLEIEDATTGRRGIVQLSTAINSNSTLTSATSSAVKQVNDNVASLSNLLTQTWTSGTPNAGWTVSGGGTFRYTKVNNLVAVDFTLYAASGYSTALFTLPIGFRPTSMDGYFAFTAYSINAGNKYFHGMINSLGTATLENVTGMAIGHRIYGQILFMI